MLFSNEVSPFRAMMLIVIWLVLLVGCQSDSDSIQPSPDVSEEDGGASEPNIDHTSVLQGGPYGSVAITLLDKSFGIVEESLPSFGRYDPSLVFSKGLDFRQQVVFPFGGFSTTLGEGVHRSGNTVKHEPVAAVLRFYPNTDYLLQLAQGTEGVIIITPVAVSDGIATCFVQSDDDASLALQPSEGNDACLKARFTLDDLVNTYSAAEFAFDLGEFTETSTFTLAATFFLEVPTGSGDGVVLSNNGAAAIKLSVNEAVAIDLPSNVYASSNFIPSLNGFGFSNLGDGSFDLFPKDLIARQYGQDAVCFVENEQCKALNPYGLFIVSSLDPHDASNGLCNGMAVASTMLANGIEPFPGSTKTVPTDYNPAASNTIELNYGDVRELIAAKQIGQLREAISNHRANYCRGLKPTQVLSEIEARFNTDDPTAVVEIFTMAREAGHALTPYALSDEGGNLRRIYVYDSNHPSDMSRFIEVDITPGQESWRYTGAVSAGAVELLYDGLETSNSMCPVPVSLYETDEVLLQPTGSTRFIDLTGVDAQIVDSEGNVSGADFDALVNINNIPGATLQTVTGSNLLTITGLSQIAGLSDLTSENFLEHLESSYVIRAQPVTEKATQELRFLQSSIVESRLTSAYIAKLVPEEPLSADERQVFRAGASARFITVEKVPSGLFAAKIFSTVNETQIGYVATVEVFTTALGINDSIGVFAADDGARYVVFSYDSVTGGNFTLLNEGVEYRLNLITLDAATVPVG
jgi:hypothetical protein